LTFPDSVNEIGEKALAECGKLEYIYHWLYWLILNI
jgi:hypothetical protein